MSKPTPDAALTQGFLWAAGMCLAGLLAWIIGIITVWRAGSWLWRMVAG